MEPREQFPQNAVVPQPVLIVPQRLLEQVLVGVQGTQILLMQDEPRAQVLQTTEFPPPQPVAILPQELAPQVLGIQEGAGEREAEGAGVRERD